MEGPRADSSGTQKESRGVNGQLIWQGSRAGPFTNCGTAAGTLSRSAGFASTTD